jgi:hypothetical protein
MNVSLAGLLHTLGLGATGLSCNQTNFIPGQSGTTSSATSGATLRRPTRFMRTFTASTVSWSSSVARGGIDVQSARNNAERSNRARLSQYDFHSAPRWL